MSAIYRLQAQLTRGRSRQLRDLFGNGGPILSRCSTATLHVILATLLRRGTCARAIEPEDSRRRKALTCRPR
jgi:hypothetical protein